MSGMDPRRGRHPLEETNNFKTLIRVQKDLFLGCPSVESVNKTCVEAGITFEGTRTELTALIASSKFVRSKSRSSSLENFFFTSFSFSRIKFLTCSFSLNV